MNKNTLIGLAMIIGLVLIIGLVGRMDYQDEIAEADLYCQNVADGVWPDYRNTYEKECKDGRHYLAEK